MTEFNIVKNSFTVVVLLLFYFVRLSFGTTCTLIKGKGRTTCTLIKGKGRTTCTLIKGKDRTTCTLSKGRGRTTCTLSKGRGRTTCTLSKGKGRKTDLVLGQEAVPPCECWYRSGKPHSTV